MAEPGSTRGSRLKKSRKTDHNTITGRKLLVTIGIDAYQHMQPLHNAVGDAIGIHRLFTRSLGFHALAPPLLNAQASKTGIESLLEDRLPALVRQDDALVLFFAGHGKSRSQEGVERGYLVPVEAHPNRWAGYVGIDWFLGRLDDLPARHVVVILDACHSGFALGQALKPTRGAPPLFAHALLGRPSRHVLTSALPEQEAYDSGPIGGHSLFTGFLIHGLVTGEADRDNNGVIMTSELSDYVRSSVGTVSKSNQTPSFGSFSYQNNKGGEMFFPSLGPRLATPLTPPIHVPRPVPPPPTVEEGREVMKEQQEAQGCVTRIAKAGALGAVGAGLMGLGVLIGIALLIGIILRDTDNPNSFINEITPAPASTSPDEVLVGCPYDPAGFALMAGQSYGPYQDGLGTIHYLDFDGAAFRVRNLYTLDFPANVTPNQWIALINTPFRVCMDSSTNQYYAAFSTIW